MTYRSLQIKLTRLALLSLSLAVLPWAANAQPRCTTTIGGTYAFTFSGTIVNPAQPNVFVPFGGVGIQTFDLNGTFTITESATFPGLLLRASKLSGTYTLNANCTGTMVAKFPDGSSQTADFVIGAGGKTIYAVGVDPAPAGATTFITMTLLTPAQ